MKLTDLIEERNEVVNKVWCRTIQPNKEDVLQEHDYSMILAFEAGKKAGYSEEYNDGIGVCGLNPVDSPTPEDLSGKTKV